MTTTPTVTITVGGVPITASTTSIPNADAVGDPNESLFMMYVQATQGDVRYQWIVFPPAREALGVSAEKVQAAGEDALYMISRVQRHEGNRAKWFHHTLFPTSVTLDETLRERIKNGFTVGCEVVVPLEQDDYLEVWNEGKTPHKAIRHIDRALAPLGTQTK